MAIWAASITLPVVALAWALSAPRFPVDPQPWGQTLSNVELSKKRLLIAIVTT